MFQLISSIKDFRIRLHHSSASSLTAVDSEYALVARGIDMVFETGEQPFQALKNVNLKVRQGRVQMIVGPSGAGKTTLLLILAGVLTPTSGQVQILGHNLTNVPRQQMEQIRLHSIGVMFQESNLLRSLTALENVEAALVMKGFPVQEARRQAKQLLDEVGLGDRAHHLPRELSGGQQQRVAVARSLAGNPPLIIADEPTAALDSTNGHIVVELMRRLAKEHGCTVLIATHDPRILSFADCIANLTDGVLTKAKAVTDLPISELTP
ncbi:MAG: ABC transporter ATP-binding protein [Leptolyngbyaceae bacterium]|nr:ABC transporter ATP-binding protein [Leptolyngbyaceae bacterium]